MKRVYRIFLFLLLLQATLFAALNDIDKERISRAIQNASNVESFSADYKKALSFGSSSPFFFSQSISLALESNRGKYLSDLAVAEAAFEATVQITRQQYENSDKIIKTAVTSTMLQTLIKSSLVKEYQPSDMARAILRGTFSAVSSKSSKVVQETMANVASGISSTLTIYFLQSKDNAIPLMESISAAVTDEVYRLLEDTRYWKQEYYITRTVVLLFTRDAILTATTTEQNTVKMAQSLFRGLYKGVLEQDTKKFRTASLKGISAGCIAGVSEASKLKDWLASTTSALISSAYIASYDALFSQIVDENVKLNFDKQKMVDLTLGFASVIEEDDALKKYHDQGVRYTIKNILYLMDVYKWDHKLRTEFFQSFAHANVQALAETFRKKEVLAEYLDPLIRFMFSEVLHFESKKQITENDLDLLRHIALGLGMAIDDPNNTRSTIKKSNEIKVLLELVIKNIFSGELNISTLEIVATSIIDGFLDSVLVAEPKVKASNQVSMEVVQSFVGAWIENVKAGTIPANAKQIKILLGPIYEHIALSVLSQNQRRPRTAPPISYRSNINWIYSTINASELPLSESDIILFVNSGIASGLAKQALSDLKTFDSDFRQMGQDLVLAPFKGKPVGAIDYEKLDVAFKAVVFAIGPIHSVLEKDQNIFQHTLLGAFEGYKEVYRNNGSTPNPRDLLGILEMIANASVEQSIPGSYATIEKFKGLKKAWLQFKNDPWIKSAYDPQAIKDLPSRAVNEAIQSALKKGTIDKSQYIEIQNLF